MEKLEKTFQTIYNANYSKVVRLCLGYVNGDEALAKDLAQEVFIKVWQHLASFRGEAQISTWIYKIAVNSCLLFLRNQKKFRKKVLDEEVYEAIAEETDQDVSQADMDQFYKCIEQLSGLNKTILLLTLEGLPQKEIAAITGLSNQALRVRVHRIKNELTACVQYEKF